MAGGVTFGRDYTPVNKFRSSISATTAVAVWTPSSSTRIALTDLSVTSAAAGTVQLRFGNVGGSVVEEFILAGSATVSRSYTSPRYNLTADQALFMESGMNGLVSVSVGGFEQET